MFPIIQLPPIPDHIPAGTRRDVYLVREVAERLHRSVDYVLRRIRSGDLAGVREGDRWVVRSSDLEAYISTLPPVKTARPSAVTPMALGPDEPLWRERGRKRAG